ncbi:MAG: SMP-30/gluconolactonase/LRE family protein, partial [Anaerolineaceae bacterium]|nr:SMP-30/gluconolactonase/LRE family protein [Anaerolineaceae bacterium]
KTWNRERLKLLFIITVGITIVAGLAAFALGYTALTNTTETDSDIGVMLNAMPAATRIEIGAAGVVAIAGLITAGILLVKGVGWKGIRDERSFDLLILQGTFVLPLLAALPMAIIGLNPLDYSNPGILNALMFLVPLFIISVLIGLWWNGKVWLINTGIFWAIFILFYTTLFTQGVGFAKGLMGALGYWLAQQGVTRGQQPLYYYALIQIPIYEYLPAFGTFIAAIMGISLGAKSLAKTRKDRSPDNEPLEFEAEIEEPVISEELFPTAEEKRRSRIVDNEGEERKPPILALLLYWSVMSLIAFSFAGERMPWLTTHITMPMILTSGLSFSYLLESFEWENFKRSRGWLVVLVGTIFILTLFQTFGSLLGANPPFQGKTLTELQATSTFLMASLGMIASAIGLGFLLRGWQFKKLAQLGLIIFIGILSVLTIRTAYRANFILYNTAEEYLVYAHASADPKDVLAQVEEISNRVANGKDIVVAYDNDLLYPYWWYFRDYPNKRYYADTPTKDLRDAPIILVGSDNYGKIEAVVADDYVQFDYTRIWWPMQDYYNLTFKRVWNAFTDPQMRSALWQIWLNRDYSEYAALTGSQSLTAETWQPSSGFRMYVRKDVVSQIWEYGAAPVTLEPSVDPYEAGTLTLDASQIIVGNGEYTLNTPRDIAFAADGTLYVTDSTNNQILHIDQDGNLIDSWGEYGASDFANGIDAPAGAFSEPWGIAVGPDGSVYVADTWNHRIQKFTSDGDFITMWGDFSAAETLYSFWGPRGVAVDDAGHVFVTDTGNKRVVIFDSDGNALTSFGGAGLEVGQFDEPVGIAVDDQGRVYIADTWNDRIQVMIPDGEGSLTYSTNIEWDIDGWYGDSLDNKPFLTIDENYNVFVSDPILGRILEFTGDGTFLRTWGTYGTAASEIGVAGGLAVDSDGRIWVADSLNGRLMIFTLPKLTPADDTAVDTVTEEDASLNNPFGEETQVEEETQVDVEPTN